VPLYTHCEVSPDRPFKATRVLSRPFGCKKGLAGATEPHIQYQQGLVQQEKHVHLPLQQNAVGGKGQKTRLNSIDSIPKIEKI
jgi:hypothetical protein